MRYRMLIVTVVVSLYIAITGLIYLLRHPREILPFRPGGGCYLDSKPVVVDGAMYVCQSSITWTVKP